MCLSLFFSCLLVFWLPASGEIKMHKTVMTVYKRTAAVAVAALLRVKGAVKSDYRLRHLGLSDELRTAKLSRCRPRMNDYSSYIDMTCPQHGLTVLCLARSH